MSDVQGGLDRGGAESEERRGDVEGKGSAGRGGSGRERTERDSRGGRGFTFLEECGGSSFRGFPGFQFGRNLLPESHEVGLDRCFDLGVTGGYVSSGFTLSFE